MKRLEDAFEKLESYGFKIDNKSAIRQIAESGTVYVPLTQKGLRSFIQEQGGVYYEFNQNGTNRQAYFTPERLETMYQFRVQEKRMQKQPISQYMSWRGMEKAEQMGKTFRPYTKKEEMTFTGNNMMKGLHTSMINAGLPAEFVNEMMYMLNSLTPEERYTVLNENPFKHDFYDSDQVGIKSNFEELYEIVYSTYIKAHPNGDAFQITEENKPAVLLATQTNSVNSHVHDILEELYNLQRRR